VHTYKTLTLGEAHIILDAAQKKAEELGIPEVLCVADNAGYPIALRRLDGGKVTSVQIAMNKAFTAAGLEQISFEDLLDSEDPAEPAVRRFRALYSFTT